MWKEGSLGYVVVKRSVSMCIFVFWGGGQRTAVSIAF